MPLALLLANMALLDAAMLSARDAASLMRHATCQQLA